MSRNNLSRGLQSHLQGMSEDQARATLRQEGRRLKYIVLKAWRGYLSQYKPVSYIRTRDTQRGISLGRVRRVDGNHLGIDVKFDDDLMYHDSVIGKNQPKGHSFMLISEGWKVTKGKHKDVYMFGYFEGADLINQIVKEYNKGRPKGLTLDVMWQGKKIR